MILPSVLFPETYRYALIQRIRRFSLMTREPVNCDNRQHTKSRRGQTLVRRNFLTWKV
ncbi:MAG: hypothetical protein UU49_C0038G0003 [Candidatus Magasanikbacteria bacterium GW2011_GWC2_41_17]|uniref:Uncharacterized protein n=2 Tax=Candidatus Magasanikiibacteriota TaxID=1752731 RepID=A0A0G0ZY28_9BACT|nr:MAG: hypothetical protein UU49_C0038G0003 [Candidatus Magasanikbacteria bacterium GW2011_GWC2_41_17]KKS53574.1 MAG: hypothetical protein UV20_C0049G0011 [Candidatus Magasanikbacteria bacterium GW2011_GWA2_42_32]